MIDLMKELSDKQKEKLLRSPIFVELFDTKFPNEMSRIVETLERKRKIALRHPDGIKSVYFEKFIDALTELVSERLLKSYFTTVFTLDVIIPNEILTKEMLSMAAKYNSPTGELEHPSQLS